MCLTIFAGTTTAPAPSPLCCKNSGGWFLKRWCSSDVNVVEYQRFALWCCTFGSKLKIIAPESVVNEMKAHMVEITEMYLSGYDHGTANFE